MSRRILLSVCGISCLLLGIVLVLRWWPAVVLLFQGVGGMALALAGMLLLFFARE